MIRSRRTRVLRLVRTIGVSFAVTVFGVNALLNFWWLIDCDYCVGHYCGKSMCEDQPIQCHDMCYRDNLIDGHPIALKRPTTTSAEEAVISHVITDRNLFWQRIDVSHHPKPIYVYSAFHSVQDNHVVIIGKAYYGQNENGAKYDHDFECYFIDDGNVNLYTSSAKFIKFDDHFDNYETTRITCQLSQMHVIMPKYVKLVHRTEQVMSEPIVIEYREPNHDSQPKEPDVVVCVRPLFDGYSSVRDLIEFIAYYRVNGVDRLVFYKESVSDLVLELLGLMSDFVDVHPWTLRNGQIEATHEDQISSVDDCLHRYRQHIIIFIDIDEFIVPFTRPTLRDLIFDHQNRDTIALSVRNVFFCCENNQNNRQDFPRILNHFNRQSTVWVRDKRSKVIALRPDLIDRMGIHEVHSVVPEESLSGVKYVHRSDALMFHYRSCCGVDRTPLLWSAMSIKTLKDTIEYDTRIYKFGQKMVEFLDNYVEFNLG